MGWPSGFKRFFTGVFTAAFPKGVGDRRTVVDVAARRARPSSAATRKALRGGIQ
jgi:hypothetical protein